MNDNAKKWVSALRSGEYKQGKEVLRNISDQYCCLGVACDLYSKEHELEIFAGRQFYYYGKEHFAYLPLVVRDWLGLTTEYGAYDEYIGHEDDVGNSLTALNDKGVPFKRIADIIESEPEGLFVK